MKFTVLSLMSKNITVVYEALDVSRLSMDRIKQAEASLGSLPRILELDTDKLVAIYDSLATVAEFGDRRIKVTDHSNTTMEGTVLPVLVYSLSRLVPSDMMAYGFNVDLVVELTETSDADRYFVDRFLKDSVKSLSQPQATISGIEPRFKILSKENIPYDLRLIPGITKEGQPIAQCKVNIHYDNQQSLPDSDLLRIQLSNHYQYTLDILTEF